MQYCLIYSHSIEFYAHIFCIYIIGCDRCPFVISLQYSDIPEFDPDTFWWHYLATLKLQKATEFVWNEVDGLNATDCHVVTPVTVAILINRMGLYDSYASSHGWMSFWRLSMYEEGLLWMKRWGENYMHGANNYDYRMSNWSVFSHEVEVKLKIAWCSQTIQTEKLEWINTSLNCLLLLIMVRGRSCWWLVSAAFSYYYWNISEDLHFQY